MEVWAMAICINYICVYKMTIKSSLSFVTLEISRKFEKTQEWPFGHVQPRKGQEILIMKNSFLLVVFRTRKSLVVAIYKPWPCEELE